MGRSARARRACLSSLLLLVVSSSVARFALAAEPSVSLADATRDPAALTSYLDSHPDGPTGALTMPDASGMRLMHWAASGGNVDVVMALAKRGADPWDGTATPEEHSALHMACQSGHADMVDYLLSEKALSLRSRGAFTKEKAANSMDKRDTPCLHMAASAGHVGVIQSLARASADLLVETKRSGTALHAAAAIGQVEVVNELLELGLSVCAENARGETPGARAREEEMDEVIKVLEEKEEEAGCGKKKKKDKKKKKSKKEL